MTSRATALKRTDDPGWAFVASLSDEEMALVLGSHVETLPAAIQKLREGGAKPDRSQPSPQTTSGPPERVALATTTKQTGVRT